MSRTYKTKPWKFVEELSWEDRHEKVPYQQEYVDYYTKEVKVRNTYCFIKKPGVLRKQKRSHITAGQFWYRSTPSWWSNMFHTRPKRREFAAFCRDVVKLTDSNLLNDAFEPYESRKPHIYYW